MNIDVSEICKYRQIKSDVGLQNNITYYKWVYSNAVQFQISNIKFFFSVRFKFLIFGYLERFDGLKSLF